MDRKELKEIGDDILSKGDVEDVYLDITFKDGTKIKYNGNWSGLK